MIAWHVYPLGFVGAPVWDDHPDEPASRLGQLTQWVDYAADLGVDTLSLGPVFASQTHGYDTVNHFRIDPRLGTEADFDRFLTAAHARGLKVLLDGVFNHVGSEHPIHQRALRRDAQACRQLRWSSGQPRTFEGHGNLIQLNHDEPSVARLVQDVLRHWLRRGVDGWRFDAAYATGPDFWAGVLPDVRAEFPASYFFGEVIHGDYAGFVARSGLDAVTQYELWKAIWSSIHDRNFFELSWTLGRHNSLLDSFTPVTFIGNHDVTRIATQLGEAGAAVALAILMTTGGSPHIYYGDEQGFTGAKHERFRGDDEIRPAFPATPDDLAPDGWWLYGLHRELIAIRRRYPWLARARVTNEQLTCQRYVYRAENPNDSADFLRVAVDVIDVGYPCATISDSRGAELFAFTGQPDCRRSAFSGRLERTSVA